MRLAWQVSNVYEGAERTTRVSRGKSLYAHAPETTWLRPTTAKEALCDNMREMMSLGVSASMRLTMWVRRLTASSETQSYACTHTAQHSDKAVHPFRR